MASKYDIVNLKNCTQTIGRVEALTVSPPCTFNVVAYANLKRADRDRKCMKSA